MSPGSLDLGAVTLLRAVSHKVLMQPGGILCLQRLVQVVVPIRVKMRWARVYQVGVVWLVVVQQGEVGLDYGG